MKKWGLIITLFYGVVVVALLVPATLYLIFTAPVDAASLKEVYSHWSPWVCAGAVMLGAVLLLWLSVDTTQKRPRPRTHILVSAIITALLMAILTLTIVLAFGLALWGERFLPNTLAAMLAAFVIPWLVWGIVFYRLCRNSSDPITRVVVWLFRGSVLELLIAVPAHVIVRRRHDCSAPVVTGFGITTGIAIMLLSFGPSVLLLYRKRMEGYAKRGSVEYRP